MTGNKIGKTLKQLRNYRGMTQEAISKELNISRQTYSYYETGQRIPDLEMACRLANFHNITLDQLVLTGLRPTGCSRSKFLSKIFKINVKNFREIFPDFTHRKRGSDFITVPFLSSGSHALRLPSAFPFSVPCLEYTLSVLQQSNLTPHISGLYALPSN